MAFPNEIDEWLSTEYEDVNSYNSNVIKNYTFLLNNAIETGDFTKLNEFINDNKDVLKKVIVSASTINNIQNAIKSVEKYVITEKRNIFISENEPANMNIGDVWLQTGSENQIICIKLKKEDETFDERTIFSPSVDKKVDNLSNSFYEYTKSPNTPRWIHGETAVNFDINELEKHVDITSQVKTYFPQKPPSNKMFITIGRYGFGGVSSYVKTTCDDGGTNYKYELIAYRETSETSEACFRFIDWAMIYSED